LIDSSSDCKRAWFDSFASRNDGEDMDENSCIIVLLVIVLRPSRYGAMLLMTASRAG
jgi:hypothetical protein